MISDTTAAMQRTVITTPRSWPERNIAWATATVPEVMASTVTTATQNSERATERRRSRRTAGQPSSPAPPAPTAAKRAIRSMSFTAGQPFAGVGTGSKR